MNKIGFETATCGRCGGSGHYSYNQLDGTRCYGCQGSGQVFTKRGKAAKLAFQAERERLCGTTADALTVGARIRYDGVVREVEAIGAGGGGSYTKDGVTVSYTSLLVTLAKRTGKLSEVGALGLHPGSRVTLANTPEQWLALVAFADTLNGARLDGQPSAATVKADATAAKRAATKAAKAVA